jgi:protein Mpv17
MMPYIALKIGLDQLVFEPPYLLAFFGIMNVSEGKTWEDYKTTIKTEYAHTFALDCAVWPAAQYLNFRYVPTRFHALYVNAISLGWASFLSYVAHRGDAAKIKATTANTTDVTTISTPEK